MTVSSAASSDDTCPYPIIRDRPFEVPEILEQYREQEGLSRVEQWSGATPWMLCKHADVRAALSDPSFSTDTGLPGYPHNAPSQRETEGDLFIRMNGAPHLLRRRTVMAALTVKQSELHRERMVEIADQAIDEVFALGSPVDLIEHYALRLTTQIICEILGVEHALAVRVVDAMANIFDLGVPSVERIAANHFVLASIRETAQQKQRQPDDSLLSHLVNVTVANGVLEFEEVVTIGRFLIGAGHETTANMIGLGALALMRDPEQRDLLMSDPATYAPLAVEELVRYFSIVQVEPSRLAVTDVELGGQTIRAGEGVVMSLLAANHDARAFPGGNHRSVDEIDITRTAIGHHVGFGYGPHQCAGQNLARVELQVALVRLFERLPGLRLAGPEAELQFKTAGLNYGLIHLPVTW